MIGGVAKFFLSLLAAASIAVLLPVILPVIALLTWRDSRRMKREARQTHCRRCGRLLGDEAIELGETAWRERMSELHWRPEWGIRRRILRKIHAVCINCGAAYEFVAKTRQFVPAGMLNGGEKA
jgi:hypothetical protein